MEVSKASLILLIFCMLSYKLCKSIHPEFFWCLLSQPVDLMGDTCKLAGTGRTLDPTWPHIPQFHPNDYNMSSLHKILKPWPSVPASCPVQHLPAGQDPAIIEHVQGSASFVSAWHLTPGTLLATFSFKETRSTAESRPHYHCSQKQAALTPQTFL